MEWGSFKNCSRHLENAPKKHKSPYICTSDGPVALLRTQHKLLSIVILVIIWTASRAWVPRIAQSLMLCQSRWKIKSAVCIHRRSHNWPGSSSKAQTIVWRGCLTSTIKGNLGYHLWAHTHILTGEFACPVQASEPGGEPRSLTPQCFFSYRCFSTLATR